MTNTIARIESLTAKFIAARDASRSAMRAANAALSGLYDREASMEEYAEARVAAGLPTAAEEAAIHDEMDRLRSALAAALRASARSVPTVRHVGASDVALVEAWIATRAS